MVKLLKVVVAIVSLFVTAKGHNLKSPSVGNIAPKDPWEIYEYIVGVTMGTYIGL